MPRKHEESDMTVERLRMKWWMKWGAIGAVFACAATVIMAMPTLGAYMSHAAAVWRSPEQLQRVDILESNQFIQGVKIQSITENIQDIRQDVREGRQDIREIKNLFIRTPTTGPTVTRNLNQTNSIP